MYRPIPWWYVCQYYPFSPLTHHFDASKTDSFWKHCGEKKKLLVKSNFFFSHNVFYSISSLYPHSPTFLTLYLYLLLNWKSLKLACNVKDYVLNLPSATAFSWTTINSLYQVEIGSLINYIPGSPHPLALHNVESQHWKQPFMVLFVRHRLTNIYNYQYQSILKFSYDSVIEPFWKHCGKKEKMLVTSIFCFSHRVF